MCGICGIVTCKDGPPQGELLTKMCDSIRHRGPDDDGYYVDPRAAIGMRRLSIIDLRTGKQPMHNEDKTVQVVFNGEIYNFKEIRAELEARGHVFYSNADTEVIPHLYEEYGEEYVHRLNGMFGIAIWDTVRKKLILTRDRLGVKPLYYAEFPDRLLFGSEAKAILLAPGVSRELDPSAVNEYLTYEYVPPPRSVYRDLRKLAPGEQLVWENGAARIRRYWDIPDEKPLDITEEDAAGQLRDLVRDAVRMRLISDVPLGVFLSGGVDSSATTALATEFSPHIKSFCIGFNEPSFDESQYAREVARALDTDHYEDHLSLSTAIDLMPDIFDRLDEPNSDPSILPTYLLSRFTRKHVTVALSGDGGDELFAGYPTYNAHRIVSTYNRMPAALRNAVAWGVHRLPGSNRNLSLEFRLKKFFGGSDYAPLERHFVWLGAFAPHEKAEYLTPDFMAAVSEKDVFAQPRIDLGLHKAKWSDVDMAQFLDLRFYLGENLMSKVDRTSMMHSLEVRTPFLDYRVVEFAWRLPSHMKLNGLKTKYILKKAMEPLVPEMVLKRKKKGFGIPLTSWIRKELKDTFMETFSASNLRMDGMFNPEAIDRILKEHLSGRADQRKKLWNLFVFLQWKQRWG